MKQNKKMNIKNLLVSFVVLTGILLLTATASAFSAVDVTVDGMNASDDVALVAGDTITMKVYFTADSDDSDIKVKMNLEGSNVDVESVTEAFTVESGHRYMKVLTMKVPNELENEVSDDAVLNLKIWGGDAVTYTTAFNTFVQRASYDIEFASVSTSDSAEAGKVFPVTVVMKNTGYNDLEDLYVTVRIPELGIQKTAYFGDVVSVEDVDNEKNDFVSGKILLDIPYTAKGGVYSLEVEAKSDNFAMSKVKQIVVENGLSSNVFVTGNKIVIANPTTQLLVLKLVPESTGSVTLSEELVVVPAGASKTITASATGDYTVNIFSKDGQLLDSVTVPASTQSGDAGNAVAVLTVILTIVFLVLLVVLIVLITKKPEKTEEFSESYY